MPKTSILLATVAAFLLAATANTDSPNMKENRPKPLLTLRVPGGADCCLRYSRDGTRLATASHSGAALWNARTGQRLRALRARDEEKPHAEAVALNQDASCLATAEYYGRVKVWDTKTGQSTLLGQMSEKVYSLAFSPDGKYLAAASWSWKHDCGGVKVWDIRTSKCKSGFEAGTKRLPSVAFSPDSRRLAVGDGSGPVTVWEVATGQEARALHNDSGLMAFAWSPSGRQLAAGYLDGTVRVLSLAPCSEALPLKGHKGAVTSVAFSFDGRKLVSAAIKEKDKKQPPHWLGEVWAWDTATGVGKRILQFGAQEHGVWKLALSPDGTRLATAHGDGTVKVWSVKDVLGR